jgi:hypothetical protein
MVRMKHARAFVIVLALAGNIAAQETPAPTAPDYSRDKLIQMFANEPVREPVQPRVQFGIGYVDFHLLNMRWRLAYLPLMPLPGSIPWQSNGAFGAIPNPFELTHTEIASPPRTWKQKRDMNAELKRIERTERIKAKVVAKPE